MSLVLHNPTSSFMSSAKSLPTPPSSVNSSQAFQASVDRLLGSLRRLRGMVGELRGAPSQSVPHLLEEFLNQIVSGLVDVVILWR